MTETITIALPYPPSVNAIFSNVPGKGRVKTQRYRTWARVGQTEIMIQRVQWPVKHIAGAVHVAITVQKTDRRKRDLDNLLKAPFDLLVDMKVIEDDSKIESLSIQWGPVEGMRVEVSEFRSAA